MCRSGRNLTSSSSISDWGEPHFVRFGSYCTPFLFLAKVSLDHRGNFEVRRKSGTWDRPGLGIGISGGGDFVVLFLGYRRQGVTVAFFYDDDFGRRPGPPNHVGSLLGTAYRAMTIGSLNHHQWCVLTKGLGTSRAELL